MKALTCSHLPGVVPATLPGHMTCSGQRNSSQLKANRIKKYMSTGFALPPATMSTNLGQSMGTNSSVSLCLCVCTIHTHTHTANQPPADHKMQVVQMRPVQIANSQNCELSRWLMFKATKFQDGLLHSNR